MTLTELVTQLGYEVHVTDFLPFERTLEDGTVKRTDYIVDQGAHVLWMSRESFEAMKGAAKP